MECKEDQSDEESLEDSGTFRPTKRDSEVFPQFDETKKKKSELQMKEKRFLGKLIFVIVVLDI